MKLGNIVCECESVVKFYRLLYNTHMYADIRKIYCRLFILNWISKMPENVYALHILKHNM